MPRTSRSVEHPAARAVLLGLLGMCMIGLAAVVFLPIGWWLNRFVVWIYYLGVGIGIPRVITIEAYDTALNALLFAVPTALVCLLWARVPWWVWVAAVALASALIELVQLLALPRDASIGDVLANTAGALIGVGIARLIARGLARKKAATRG